MALLKEKIINFILELKPIKDELRRRDMAFMNDMCCAPSTFDFYTGKGHPLNDGLTDNQEATK